MDFQGNFFVLKLMTDQAQNTAPDILLVVG